MEIHSGDNTQIQLHDIIPQNFNIMKTIVNSSTKTMPPLPVVFLFSILVYPPILKEFLSTIPKSYRVLLYSFSQYPYSLPFLTRCYHTISIGVSKLTHFMSAFTHIFHTASLTKLTTSEPVSVYIVCI